jgi:hyperosmotically inducible periplasmic protein
MGKMNWLRGTAMAVLVGAALAACAPMQGRESAGEYVDDTAITAKIKAELVRDKELPATQIRVETLQNVVQLSGFVDTAAQKAKAGQMARQIAGVRDVKNDIIVR